MKEYHKIQSIFKRDPENDYRFTNEYSSPEFEYLKNNEWGFTEKVDGTNIRVIWNGNSVRFGGKTDNAQIPTFLYDRLNELFPKELMLSKYPHMPMTLYGEGYGARIQKSGGNYKSNGVDFVLFDVLIDNWWLLRGNTKDISLNLGVDIVPIVGTGDLSVAIEMCKKGFNSYWGDFEAEGIVLRNPIGLMNRAGHRIITKVKCKDFKK